MADTKISDLTGVASVAGTNEFAVNEAGTSKKATAAQIATYALSTMIVHEGVYATGSFTVETGHFAVMVKSLVLTSTEQLVLQGTARLRID
jgi:hypothetical protein